MGNRIGGFLILLASIGAIGGFYWYFYIFNITDVTFHSNEGNFHIELQNKQQIIKQECGELQCEIKDIPPFEFLLTAKKPGYKTISKNIKFSRKIEIFDLEFQKNYELVPLEKLNNNTDEILENFENSQDKTIEEKIAEKRDEIKKNRNLYLEIQTEENTYKLYSQNENQDILTLYKNDILLGNIPKISKSDLKIFEIYGSNKNFIFSGNNTLYFFSEYSKNYIELELKIPLKYVKKINQIQYIFQTEKGPFLWKKNKNIFEYNHLFSDYIILKGSYIGFISQNNPELQKKIFPNFSENKNIIYQYIPENKEKNILFSTDISIEKIYFGNNKILLSDSEKSLYYIPHFEGNL